MYVVIVGGGYIGFFLAKYFSRRGDRVVVIERNRRICDRISKMLDVVVYCGDATREKVLRDAEVDKADVLMAVTGKDSVNIRVGEVAKKRFGVPFVLVRVNEAENKKKAAETGADRVVCMDDFAVYFASLVSRKGYKYLTSFDGKVIVELDVPPDSPIIGQSPQEILARGVMLLLAVHGGEPIENLAEYLVRADDKLILFGEDRKMEEFLDYVFGG